MSALDSLFPSTNKWVEVLTQLVATGTVGDALSILNQLQRRFGTHGLTSISQAYNQIKRLFPESSDDMIESMLWNHNIKEDDLSHFACELAPSVDLTNLTSDEWLMITRCFLLSHTFKDCSLMVSIHQPVHQADTISCNVRIIDCDRKSHWKIPYYAQLERDIATAFTQHEHRHTIQHSCEVHIG